VDGRSEDCPLYVVHAHHEPTFFTAYFKVFDWVLFDLLGWDFAVKDDVYTRKLKKLNLESDQNDQKKKKEPKKIDTTNITIERPSNQYDISR
jgi:hypothetical protein